MNLRRGNIIVATVSAFLLVTATALAIYSVTILDKFSSSTDFDGSSGSGVQELIDR